jgi:putative membrane protein
MVSTPQDETPSPVDDPRVYLAAERTYLAWVRTSLGLIGFGFVIARFGFVIRGMALMDPSRPYSSKFSPYLGFAIVCLGVVVCVASAVRYRSYVKALRAGIANPQLGIAASMALAVVLAVAGLLMAIHILTT